MNPPNRRERQIMQRLRNAGWVKATALPDRPKTLANLISKGWVEKLRQRMARRIASPIWDCRRRRRLFRLGRLPAAMFVRDKLAPSE